MFFSRNFFRWLDLLAKLMVQEASSEMGFRVESAVAASSSSSSPASTVRQMYFVLLNLRRTCQLSGLSSDTVHAAFAPALPALADLIISEMRTQVRNFILVASYCIHRQQLLSLQSTGALLNFFSLPQVDRALDLERKNHEAARQEGREGREWLQDAAGAGADVEGVFSTCIFTFRELDWPEPAAYVDFGITVFRGIHQVWLVIVWHLTTVLWIVFVCVVDHDQFRL